MNQHGLIPRELNVTPLWLDLFALLLILHTNHADGISVAQQILRVRDEVFLEET